jgi:DNA-binding FadR family transcriptional regulator
MDEFNAALDQAQLRAESDKAFFLQVVEASKQRFWKEITALLEKSNNFEYRLNGMSMSDSSNIVLQKAYREAWNEWVSQVEPAINARKNLICSLIGTEEDIIAPYLVVSSWLE